MFFMRIKMLSFTHKITQKAQKEKKAYKAQNVNKRLSLRPFIRTKKHKKNKKHKKHKKYKTSNKRLSSSQMFLLIIKMLSFTHKKAQKIHKKHKNEYRQTSDFLPLRCFYVHLKLPFLFLFAHVYFCVFYAREIFS